ncbi:UNVERIFIED_CONTAM: hypothetical protein Slati_2732300 [Sesamum latifolium]|uniref:Uncharacterized protein n=1 Tax=Sesamum latifolium TaxID=2727402 RepID=A0AAW2W124_9LAMI
MSSTQAQKPSLRYALRSFCGELVSSVPCRHLNPPSRRQLSPASGGQLAILPARFLNLAPSRAPRSKP